MPGKPAQPGGISDPFVLWSGRRDVVMKYASEELRDFWAISPRVAVTGYATQVAQADRVAREDITTAEITETEVTTDGGLDADGVEAVRHGEPAGTAVGTVRPG